MDSLDELRRLRVRAYGPAADIHDDVAALQRLRELEAQQEQQEQQDQPPHPEFTTPDAASAPPHVEPPRESVVTPGPSAPVHDQPDRLAAASASAAAPATTHPESDAADSDRAPARMKRSTRVLWALSVVTAAAAAAAVTFAAVYIAPVSTSHGARQIATLSPSTTTNIPSGWFGAGPSSVAFEFYGLTLYESSSGYGMSPGTDCLNAVITDDLPDPDTENEMNNWSIQGVLYAGCRVGAFPATISMPVGSSSPQELRDQFPANSALQFVFDGTQVGVFLDAE